MKNIATAAALAAAAAVAAADAPKLEWRLTRHARIEGNILTVDVPPGKAAEGGRATATIDMSRFGGDPFEATIVARGERISKPKNPWNGLKFMFSYRDLESGDMRYPNTAPRLGDFPEQTIRVVERNTDRRIGKAELALGLQESSGKVVFDLSTLRIGGTCSYWPVTNQTLAARYTPDVAARGARRGVMSPSRPMTENDFKTLEEWGVTLLRYQMVRGWHDVDANRDLAEYNRWLGGRLDHFDRFVLPQAVKRGIAVVLDLHVPPGGRDASRDMNMFYEAKYAEHFVELWRRIAARFKGREGIYGYDLINEPVQTREALPGCDWWNLQRRAAEAVRSEDPHTPIVMESNEWDCSASYSYMSPLDLTNVVYQAHMYDPGSFTHQGVRGRSAGYGYPNPARKWDREYIRRRLKPVLEFQRRHGARMYVGEFSAAAWAPGAENYLRDCIGLFEEYGWDWTYHAFREYSGWSVEHEGPDREHLRPAADTPRRRALLEGLGAGRRCGIIAP